MSAEEIQRNVQKIRERIAGAAAKAGRRMEEITLIGVSKTHPAEAVREAFGAGETSMVDERRRFWKLDRRSP